MKLNELVATYRADHHLSTREFAKRCGLSYGYINMIERGENPATGKPIKPTVEKLNSIARGMGLTLNDLFDRLEDTDVSIENQSEDDKIIEAYRVAPEHIKEAIRTLLGVKL